jgi:Sigma-70 region 2
MMDLDVAYVNYLNTSDMDELLVNVTSAVRAITRDEDLTQDVVIRTWSTLDGYDPNRGTFSGWVNGKIRSCRSHDLRKKNLPTVSLDECPEPSAFTPVITPIDGMPEDLRAFVTALMETGNRKAARLKLGITDHTSRKLMKKIKKHLHGET